MGVDPGSRFTGYGVLRRRGRQLSRVASGRIKLPPKAPPEVRFATLLDELDSVFEQNAPGVVAVEDIFTHRNARSALMLGQARGVVLAAAGRRELPVVAYPPATIKKAVAGHGRADKAQIQRMVKALLGLEEVPAEDEADALAAAICHALMSRASAVATGRRMNKK